jgi:hypothetical protein
MAMSPKCAAQLQQAAAAAGRTLSPGKLVAIDDALRGKMVELARQDRQRWQSLPYDQRVREATAAALADMDTAAKRTEHLAALQVVKVADIDTRIQEAMALNKGVTRSQGTARVIEHTHNTIAAIRNENIGHLGDMLEAAQNRDGTGVLRNLGMRIFDVDNPKMTADVVREVFRNADGSTGNKAAQAGAKAWLDTIEGMRLRFNKAGGDVGKLGYGYLTQAHDAVRVFKAGADTWAAKVLPLLDREQYVKPDGTLMGDSEVIGVLKSAWQTLTEGGANKTDPGQFKGVGAAANRGSDHRVLHFADGDAWMAYMKDFGEGSLYDSMIGHVGKMARDIGMVEDWGPNAAQTFRVMADMAERTDGAGTLKSRSAGNTPQAYWDILSGTTGMPENRVVARVGQDLRNVQTAAKLGGAVITSMTDAATIATTLRFNKLPYFEMLRNIGQQFDKDTRRFLQAHGVIGEALASSLNRWTGDHLTHSLSGRVAGAVMKVSLMNAWSDGLRAAFSQTMMGGLARMAKKDWAKLDGWDQYLLARHGITEADWAIVRQATPDKLNGYEMLTAESVRATGADGAQQVASKILGFVIDEAQFAVINPDMATRAIATGGGMQAGTLKGEAMRSFAQFKSFPIAMMTRHWRRIVETPQGLEGAPRGFGAHSAAGGVANRTAVFAALGVTSMLLGAGVLQVKALLQGKDPYDATEEKFWMRAMAQGGGLGYFGDLIFKDPTEQRGNTVEQTIGTVLGPVAGSVAGLVGDLGVVNAWEAAKGKDTHFGAEGVRWLNAQVPGQSLWWTRPAYEHWFLHSAQEMLNPGYLARMQQRAQKDWGQDYYWTPGEALPDRAPDFGAALGQ